MSSLLFLFIPFALTLFADQAHAGESLRHSGNFGIGLGGGDFAGGHFGGGLSGKYWLTDKSALQATISGRSSAFGVTYSSSALSADYLIEMPLITSKNELELGWNFGPGVGLAQVASGPYSATSLGISGVLGLEVNLTIIPIDIVIEYRPLFWMSDSNTGVRIVNTSSHIRYYFN